MESIAASFASGEPVASETREESERIPRSFADCWINLYNQTQATICPIIEPTPIHIME